jgi:protocatechuate 3,4-dioxygenase beta subunit
VSAGNQCGAATDDYTCAAQPTTTTHQRATLADIRSPDRCPTHDAPTQAPPTVTQPAPTATSVPPTQVPPTAVPTAIVLQPTPECPDDDDDVTIAQTEGPYFKARSPQRTSLLEQGITGTKLVITGRVLGTNCQPIARALIDFWQCDAGGQYDNVGFRLRGHQYTNDAGLWTLETVVPGLYPGRTRHIHVKVQAPNKPVLTSQLYFPNEPGNARDGIYHPDLVMNVRDVPDGKAATFNFVLRV